MGRSTQEEEDQRMEQVQQVERYYNWWVNPNAERSDSSGDERCEGTLEVPKMTKFHPKKSEAPTP